MSQTPPEPNGARRRIITIFAFIYLVPLLAATAIVLYDPGALGPTVVILLAVFLGLHAAAFTAISGRSPWPDIEHLLRGRLSDPPPDNVAQLRKRPPDDAS